MAGTKAVTKDMIIEASLAILNRDGIDGLTMRAIASELDIKAASLYWHFTGKQALWGALAEQICEGCARPDENPAHPEAYLKAAYSAYREMLLTVRDSTVLFDNTIPSTPRRVEIIRRINAHLARLGIAPEILLTVSNMLNNYVLSFVADETRFKNRSAEEMAKLVALLDPDNNLVLTSARNMDEQFELGLKILFSGLEKFKNGKL